jgi:hypothetical protein
MFETATRASVSRNAQLSGALVAALGLLALAVHPALYYLGFSNSAFQSYLLASWLLQWAGAFAVTLGAWTAVTGQRRPLTTVRALVAPLAVAVPWVLVQYQPAPKIDYLGPDWTAPTLAEVFVSLSTTPAGAMIGGSILAGVGAAVAREEWNWAAGLTGLALAAALNMALVSGHQGTTAFEVLLVDYAGPLLVVGVAGLVPLVVGLLFARIPDDVA